MAWAAASDCLAAQACHLADADGPAVRALGTAGHHPRPSQPGALVVGGSGAGAPGKSRDSPVGHTIQASRAHRRKGHRARHTQLQLGLMGRSSWVKVPCAVADGGTRQTAHGQERTVGEAGSGCSAASWDGDDAARRRERNRPPTVTTDYGTEPNASPSRRRLGGSARDAGLSRLQVAGETLGPRGVAVDRDGHVVPAPAELHRVDRPGFLAVRGDVRPVRGA